ncbi:uncharacterized protein [Halyomorpha halys]|uniref:uncharacterized protein n=1 Tax=Halyomorpha halys TaxID=286706 RepID=UPI0006D4DD77|nr:uncharacterized protein LOC106680558 [Halyomorpha halys]
MNLRSNNSSFVFIISWLLYFFNFYIFCFGEESCRLDDVFGNHCGENSECLQEKDNVGICHCKESFKLENGKCIPVVVPSKDEYVDDDHPVVSEGSSIALWIVIPCMILALAGAIFFLIKRLKLIEKLYQFRVRRYNTVFVTSLQDDDAPIT